MCKDEFTMYFLTATQDASQCLMIQKTTTHYISDVKMKYLTYPCANHLHYHSKLNFILFLINCYSMVVIFYILFMILSTYQNRI